MPLPTGPPRWIGELVTGMADGSGYQYKRNRYYSPSSGRFTQEDPIGLAGGLNAYGFGGGDPISFSDPLGTCPPEDSDFGPSCSGWWSLALEAVGAAAGAVIGGTSGGAAGAAACAAVGATVGAKRGALIGAAAGVLVETTLALARAGGSGAGNQGPNDAVDRIVKQTGLNREGRRALHDIITRQDLSLEEILEQAKRLSQQLKYTR